jgi:hypothetical protein
MSIDNQVETHPVVDLAEFRHRLAVAYRILINNSIQNHMLTHRIEISNRNERKLVDKTISTSAEKLYPIE